MDIKEVVMKSIGLAKSFITKDISGGSSRSIDDELAGAGYHVDKALTVLLIPEPQPLTAYEVR